MVLTLKGAGSFDLSQPATLTGIGTVWAQEGMESQAMISMPNTTPINGAPAAAPAASETQARAAKRAMNGRSIISQSVRPE